MRDFDYLGMKLVVFANKCQINSHCIPFSWIDEVERGEGNGLFQLTSKDGNAR